MTNAETIIHNAFDDDLIDQALRGLLAIWQRNSFSRQLAQLDTSCFIALLQSIKNSENSKTTLNGLTALQALLKDGDLQLIDLCVRYKCIQILGGFVKDKK